MPSEGTTLTPLGVLAEGPRGRDDESRRQRQAPLRRHPHLGTGVWKAPLWRALPLACAATGLMLVSLSGVSLFFDGSDLVLGIIFPLHKGVNIAIEFLTILETIEYVGFWC